MPAHVAHENDELPLRFPHHRQQDLGGGQRPTQHFAQTHGYSSVDSSFASHASQPAAQNRLQQPQPPVSSSPQRAAPQSMHVGQPQRNADIGAELSIDELEAMDDDAHFTEAASSSFNTSAVAAASIQPGAPQSADAPGEADDVVRLNESVVTMEELETSFADNDVPAGHSHHEEGSGSHRDAASASTAIAAAPSFSSVSDNFVSAQPSGGQLEFDAAHSAARSVPLHDMSAQVRTDAFSQQSHNQPAQQRVSEQRSHARSNSILSQSSWSGATSSLLTRDVAECRAALDARRALLAARLARSSSSSSAVPTSASFVGFGSQSFGSYNISNVMAAADDAIHNLPVLVRDSKSYGVRSPQRRVPELNATGEQYLPQQQVPYAGFSGQASAVNAGSGTASALFSSSRMSNRGALNNDSSRIVASPGGFAPNVGLADDALEGARANGAMRAADLDGSSSSSADVVGAFTGDLGQQQQQRPMDDVDFTAIAQQIHDQLQAIDVRADRFAPLVSAPVDVQQDQQLHQYEPASKSAVALDRAVATGGRDPRSSSAASASRHHARSGSAASVSSSAPTVQKPAVSASAPRIRVPPGLTQKQALDRAQDFVLQQLANKPTSSGTSASASALSSRALLSPGMAGDALSQFAARSMLQASTFGGSHLVNDNGDGGDAGDTVDDVHADAIFGSSAAQQAAASQLRSHTARMRNATTVHNAVLLAGVNAFPDSPSKRPATAASGTANAVSSRSRVTFFESSASAFSGSLAQSQQQPPLSSSSQRGRSGFGGMPLSVSSLASSAFSNGVSPAGVTPATALSIASPVEGQSSFASVSDASPALQQQPPWTLTESMVAKALRLDIHQSEGYVAALFRRYCMYGGHDHSKIVHFAGGAVAPVIDPANPSVFAQALLGNTGSSTSSAEAMLDSAGKPLRMSQNAFTKFCLDAGLIGRGGQGAGDFKRGDIAVVFSMAVAKMVGIGGQGQGSTAVNSIDNDGVGGAAVVSSAPAVPLHLRMWKTNGFGFRSVTRSMLHLGLDYVAFTHALLLCAAKRYCTPAVASSTGSGISAAGGGNATTGEAASSSMSAWVQRLRASSGNPVRQQQQQTSVHARDISRITALRLVLLRHALPLAIHTGMLAALEQVYTQDDPFAAPAASSSFATFATGGSGRQPRQFDLDESDGAAPANPSLSHAQLVAASLTAPGVRSRASSISSTTSLSLRPSAYPGYQPAPVRSRSSSIASATAPAAPVINNDATIQTVAASPVVPARDPLMMTISPSLATSPDTPDQRAQGGRAEDDSRGVEYGDGADGDADAVARLRRSAASIESRIASLAASSASGPSASGASSPASSSSAEVAANEAVALDEVASSTANLASPAVTAPDVHADVGASSTAVVPPINLGTPPRPGRRSPTPAIAAVESSASSPAITADAAAAVAAAASTRASRANSFTSVVTTTSTIAAAAAMSPGRGGLIGAMVRSPLAEAVVTRSSGGSVVTARSRSASRVSALDHSEAVVAVAAASRTTSRDSAAFASARSMYFDAFTRAEEPIPGILVPVATSASVSPSSSAVGVADDENAPAAASGAGDASARHDNHNNSSIASAGSSGVTMSGMVYDAILTSATTGTPLTARASMTARSASASHAVSVVASRAQSGRSSPEALPPKQMSLPALSIAVRNDSEHDGSTTMYSDAHIVNGSSFNTDAPARLMLPEPSPAMSAIPTVPTPFAHDDAVFYPTAASPAADLPAPGSGYDDARTKSVADAVAIAAAVAEEVRVGFSAAGHSRQHAQPQPRPQSLPVRVTSVEAISSSSAGGAITLMAPSVTTDVSVAPVVAEPIPGSTHIRLEGYANRAVRQAAVYAEHARLRAHVGHIPVSRLPTKANNNGLQHPRVAPASHARSSSVSPPSLSASPRSKQPRAARPTSSIAAKRFNAGGSAAVAARRSSLGVSHTPSTAPSAPAMAETHVVKPTTPPTSTSNVPLSARRIAPLPQSTLVMNVDMAALNRAGSSSSLASVESFANLDVGGQNSNGATTELDASNIPAPSPTLNVDTQSMHNIHEHYDGHHGDTTAGPVGVGALQQPRPSALLRSPLLNVDTSSMRAGSVASSAAADNDGRIADLTTFSGFNNTAGISFMPRSSPSPPRQPMRVSDPAVRPVWRPNGTTRVADEEAARMYREAQAMLAMLAAEKQHNDSTLNYTATGNVTSASRVRSSPSPERIRQLAQPKPDGPYRATGNFPDGLSVYELIQREQHHHQSRASPLRSHDRVVAAASPSGAGFQSPASGGGGMRRSMSRRNRYRCSSAAASPSPGRRAEAASPQHRHSPAARLQQPADIFVDLTSLQRPAVAATNPAGFARATLNIDGHGRTEKWDGGASDAGSSMMTDAHPFTDRDAEVFDTTSMSAVGGAVDSSSITSAFIHYDFHTEGVGQQQAVAVVPAASDVADASPPAAARGVRCQQRSIRGSGMQQAPGSPYRHPSLVNGSNSSHKSMSNSSGGSLIPGIGSALLQAVLDADTGARNAANAAAAPTKNAPMPGGRDMRGSSTDALAAATADALSVLGAHVKVVAVPRHIPGVASQGGDDALADTSRIDADGNEVVMSSGGGVFEPSAEAVQPTADTRARVYSLRSNRSNSVDSAEHMHHDVGAENLEQVRFEIQQQQQQQQRDGDGQQSSVDEDMRSGLPMPNHSVTIYASPLKRQQVQSPNVSQALRSPLPASPSASPTMGFPASAGALPVDGGNAPSAMTSANTSPIQYPPVDLTSAATAVTDHESIEELQGAALPAPSPESLLTTSPDTHHLGSTRRMTSDFEVSRHIAWSADVTTPPPASRIALAADSNNNSPIGTGIDFEAALDHGHHLPQYRLDDGGHQVQLGDEGYDVVNAAGFPHAAYGYAGAYAEGSLQSSLSQQRGFAAGIAQLSSSPVSGPVSPSMMMSPPSASVSNFKYADAGTTSSIEAALASDASPTASAVPVFASPLPQHQQPHHHHQQQYPSPPLATPPDARVPPSAHRAIPSTERAQREWQRRFQAAVTESSPGAPDRSNTDAGHQFPGNHYDDGNNVEPAGVFRGYPSYVTSGGDDNDAANVNASDEQQQRHNNHHNNTESSSAGTSILEVDGSWQALFSPGVKAKHNGGPAAPTPSSERFTYVRAGVGSATPGALIAIPRTRARTASPNGAGGGSSGDGDDRIGGGSAGSGGGGGGAKAVSFADAAPVLSPGALQRATAAAAAAVSSSASTSASSNAGRLPFRIQVHAGGVDIVNGNGNDGHSDENSVPAASAMNNAAGYGVGGGTTATNAAASPFFSGMATPGPHHQHSYQQQHQHAGHGTDPFYRPPQHDQQHSHGLLTGPHATVVSPGHHHHQGTSTSPSGHPSTHNATSPATASVIGTPIGSHNGYGSSFNSGGPGVQTTVRLHRSGSVEIITSPPPPAPQPQPLPSLQAMSAYAAALYGATASSSMASASLALAPPMEGSGRTNEAPSHSFAASPGLGAFHAATPLSSVQMHVPVQHGSTAAGGHFGSSATGSSCTVVNPLRGSAAATAASQPEPSASAASSAGAPTELRFSATGIIGTVHSTSVPYPYANPPPATHIYHSNVGQQPGSNAVGGTIDVSAEGEIDGATSALITTLSQMPAIGHGGTVLLHEPAARATDDAQAESATLVAGDVRPLGAQSLPLSGAASLLGGSRSVAVDGSSSLSFTSLMAGADTDDAAASVASRNAVRNPTFAVLESLISDEEIAEAVQNSTENIGAYGVVQIGGTRVSAPNQPADSSSGARSSSVPPPPSSSSLPTLLAPIPEDTLGERASASLSVSTGYTPRGTPGVDDVSDATAVAVVDRRGGPAPVPTVAQLLRSLAMGMPSDGAASRL